MESNRREVARCFRWAHEDVLAGDWFQAGMDAANAGMWVDYTHPGPDKTRLQYRRILSLLRAHIKRQVFLLHSSACDGRS